MSSANTECDEVVVSDVSELQTWMLESSRKLMMSFSECVGKMPESEVSYQYENGMKLLNHFISSMIMLVFVSKRDRDDPVIFEEKTIDMKRMLVDGLSTTINTYFHRDDNSMKTGNT